MRGSGRTAALFIDVSRGAGDPGRDTMNPTDMTGTYVTQRRVEMQARADDYRRTTSDRASHQPRSTAVSDWLARVRQFATVEIRPIGVGDESLIRDGFAKLSAQSRRSRFL